MCTPAFYNGKTNPLLPAEAYHHLVKCSLAWKTLQIWRIRYYSPFCIDFIKHHYHAILDFADIWSYESYASKKTWHVRQGIGSYGTCVAAQVTLVVPTWANGSHCHHQILGKTTTQMDLSKVSLLTLTDSEARLFDCFAIFFFNLMVLLWWCFFHGFPALFMFQPLSNENSEQRRLPFLSDGPFGFEASDSLITKI